MGLARRQMFAQKKLRAQYEKQIEAERNGAPVPEDISARLTKPKTVEMLYQLKADVRLENGKHRTIPCSPKAGYKFCEALLVALNGGISTGNLPAWVNTRIEPVFIDS